MSTHVALFDSSEFFERILRSVDPPPSLEEASEHLNQFFAHLRKDLPARLNKYIKFSLPYRAAASQYSWEPAHVFEKRKLIGLKDDFLDVCSKIDSRIETERRTGFETEMTLKTLSDEVERLRLMLKLIEQIITPSKKPTHNGTNAQTTHRHQIEPTSLLASLSPNSLPCTTGRVKIVQRKTTTERKSDRSASCSSSEHSTPIDVCETDDEATEEKTELKIDVDSSEESEFDAYSEEIHTLRTLIDEDVSPSPSSISSSSLPAISWKETRKSVYKKMSAEQDPLTVYYFPSSIGYGDEVTEFCPLSTIIDPMDLLVSYKKITKRFVEQRKWKTQEDLLRLYFP